jgi:hypothetical protein
MRFSVLILALLAPLAAQAQVSHEQLDRLASEAQTQVVEWRRWFHQNPEYQDGPGTENRNCPYRRCCHH